VDVAVGNLLLAEILRMYDLPVLLTCEILQKLRTWAVDVPRCPDDIASHVVGSLPVATGQLWLQEGAPSCR
jgi:hypothetical protein